MSFERRICDLGEQGRRGVQYVLVRVYYCRTALSWLVHVSCESGVPTYHVNAPSHTSSALKFLIVSRPRNE
jgi:hypothetical protein